MGSGAAEAGKQLSRCFVILLKREYTGSKLVLFEIHKTEALR